MIRKLWRQQSLITQIIWSLLLLTAIAAALLGRWSLMFVSVVTLVLALMPPLLAQRWNIRLPMAFVVATTAFLIGSIFMGEAFNFYEKFWWWDIALHGSSAIGFGLIGFVFVFMLFEGDRFAAPPSAVCLMAFGLAVTVGVLWEIFEFSMDMTFGLNMQKSGLMDTMGDLIVDVLGAALAAGLGYIYLKAPQSTFWSGPIKEFVTLNKRLFRKSRD